MANITNLSQFLSDVANAIRTKKNSDAAIPAAEFDNEILNIETGINTSDATATEDNIENGYTAYANGKKISGSITTAVDTIITAGADATITDTGEALNIDRGYGEKIVLKSEQQLRSTIPYNTLANIAGLTPEKLIKGEIVLGVEGTAEGDSRYNAISFKTIQDMENDTISSNYPENTMGIVADNIWSPTSTNTIVNTVKCPERITLPRAVTNTITGVFHCDDGTNTTQWDYQIELTPTSYTFGRDYYPQVEYTSNDGVNYTRVTDLPDDLYAFDLYDGWSTNWDDDILDNFILTVQTKVYGFGSWSNVDMIQFLNTPVIKGDNTLEFTSVIKIADLDTLGDYLINTVFADLGTSVSVYARYIPIILTGENCYDVYISSSGTASGNIVYDNEIWYLCSRNYRITKVSIDLNENSYTTEDITLSSVDRLGDVYKVLELTDDTRWNILGLFLNKTGKGHYFIQEAPEFRYNGITTYITIPTLGWNIQTNRESNYDGTITPTEYEEAVKTAKEIKGEEVIE